MQRASNRMILRRLRNTSRLFLEKNHDLEKYGKRRYRVVSKKLGERYAVVLMLQHMQNLLRSSLQNVDDQNLTFAITEYLAKLGKFEGLIDANCLLPKTPVKKGIVSRILTSHTNFFNRVLELDLKPNVVQAINLDELTKMIQTGVYVWGNDFKSAKRHIAI